MAQGPFDPDAAAEERETMRSSAFDASEKPVVGGKLEPSKIAVIGEGLASKMKLGPTSLVSGTDLKEVSIREAGTIRFAHAIHTSKNYQEGTTCGWEANSSRQ